LWCRSEFSCQWSRNRYWPSCYCRYFFKVAGNITMLKRIILLFFVPLATVYVLLNIANFCISDYFPLRHTRDIVDKLKYFLRPCAYFLIAHVQYLQIWRLNWYVLNKQSRAADKGRSCSLGFGHGAKSSMLRNATKVSDLDEFQLGGNTMELVSTCLRLDTINAHLRTPVTFFVHNWQLILVA
jgi:hypothetical protein